MKKLIMALTLAAVLGGGIASALAEDHGHGHGDEHLKTVLADKGREDVTLIKIMHDLAYNMNRIQFGIYTDNRYMVEEGAKAVADHPMPKGGLKPYIKMNADKIKDIVPEYDQIIHKTSRDLLLAAPTAPMQDLQAMANKMAEGCVSCHDVFRGPINR